MILNLIVKSFEKHINQRKQYKLLKAYVELSNELINEDEKEI